MMTIPDRAPRVTVSLVGPPLKGGILPKWHFAEDTAN